MGIARFYLVNHIGYQAFDLVRVDRRPAIPHANGGLKFNERNTRASNRSSVFIFGFLIAASEEDFAKEVTQSNISPALKSQVDSVFDKLLLLMLQGLVESLQVP